jgi:hypothetical protein
VRLVFGSERAISGSQDEGGGSAICTPFAPPSTKPHSAPGSVLSQALRATFVRRGTPIPAAPPVALTNEFATDAAKVAQWTAFVARAGTARNISLDEAVEAIAGFAWPPLDAAREMRRFPKLWAPAGPWRSGRRAELAPSSSLVQNIGRREIASARRR